MWALASYDTTDHNHNRFDFEDGCGPHGSDHVFCWAAYGQV